MQIDHDPNERRVGYGIYWILWAFIAFGWFGFWYLDLLDWHSAALGGVSGMVLATWAIEITGNKVPDSWRPKPPRR